MACLCQIVVRFDPSLTHAGFRGIIKEDDLHTGIKMDFCNSSNRETRLLSERQQAIRELAGYSKRSWGNNAPTSDQLARMAMAEMEADLDARFNGLRSRFGFKRRDLTVDGPIDGAGTIATPVFRYHINVELDATDSSQIVWRRTISDVMEAESVFSRPFLDVFGDEFRILEIQLENGLDVEQIIDRVEESDNDSMQIDYDRNATWCEIKISPVDLAVRVHADRIRVISSKGITPQVLVAEYYEIQRQFIHEADWDVPDPPEE